MKQIPLTQGKVALVDDADYDWLSRWTWYAHRHRRTFYAARTSSSRGGQKPKTIYMHQCILKPETGILTDHRDGNGLNNQRHNLRTSTHAKNMHNCKPYHTMNGCPCSSQYKGVSWHIRKKKWIAHIRVNGQKIYLGYFSDEIEAAKVYDTAAIKHFGKFARLNFEINHPSTALRRQAV